MLSKFLGQMAMTIYNQTYGTSSIVTLVERYNNITSQAMSMDVFKAIILTIKSLAFGITLLLYLIDLMNKATEKNFSIEQFFKATLRCVTAYMFIMNSDAIVGYLMDIGATIATETPNINAGYSLFGTDDEGRKNKIMLINGISKLKWIDIVAYIATSILPWLIAMISEVILQIVLISRILEIIVMTTFSPLSISDIYREGTASPGVQYMKKMFALGMQVAVIIMINTATQAIVASIVGSGTGATIAGLLEPSSYTGEVEDALQSGTLIFTTDSIVNFLNALTGNGNFMKVLGIILARLGLIWNSMPLCEEITGAK